MKKILFAVMFIALFFYANASAQAALPQVSIVSVPKIVPKVKGEQIYYNALQGTQFVVCAEDSAGIGSILVKVDGQEWTPYTGPVTVPAGKHIITAKAQNTQGLWSNEYKANVSMKDRRSGILVVLCGIAFLIIAHLT
ncbi:hypothetical protein HY792_03375 [Candidatus Desantisbacteria bacterium]|nr:hypothetical protein [Candidatus Desantisbacteria bacterium]